MRKVPTHRRVRLLPFGREVVGLAEFGGDEGDPTVAWIKVGGDAILDVVAPASRASWDDVVEQRFRAEVRRLAATHDLLDQRGRVSVVFAPDSAEAAGEPIERA